jgi:hypothetical protein
MRGAAAAIALAAACSSAPANVAGTYSASITQGSDGCQVATVMEGTVTPGTIMTITQSGGDLQLAATGALQGTLDQIVGTYVFSGSIDGNSLQLAINGAHTRSVDGCVFDLDAVITASAGGNQLSGALAYRAVSEDPTCLVINDAGSGFTGGVECDTEDPFIATKN